MKNYLIVGKGNMGQRYRKMLIEREPTCQVYFDKVKYGGWESLKDIKFTAAFICTPTESHVTSINQVFDELGPMPILVEKPLTCKESDREAIYDLGMKSIKHGVAIYTAYNLRHTVAIHACVQMVNEYTGPVRYLAVCKSNSEDWLGKREFNNVVIELSHEIDYLKFILGDIKDVMSFNTNDTAMLRLEHGSGTISYAYLNMSTIHHERYFTVDPHGKGRWTVPFKKDDIDASYHVQLDYFFQNLYNPYIDNNIMESLLLNENDYSDVGHDVDHEETE
jgi:predicted dehydrogenase